MKVLKWVGIVVAAVALVGTILSYALTADAGREAKANLEAAGQMERDAAGEASR